MKRVTRPSTLAHLATLGLVMAGLLAVAPATALAAEASGETSLSLWALIKQGGWAMWPLGACSLLTLVLTIHASRETRRARFIPDNLLGVLSDHLESRNVTEAARLVAADRTVLGRILQQGLGRARPEMPDANKARIEESVAEGIEHEDAAIGQWINYLNVVATVAPMIGLLGTVSGMIGAFQTISAGGMGRPELLAGDIGEALITTAAGLVIGIPAMIAYFILRNRLANQILATVQTATRLIDRLAGEAAATEAEPASERS